MMDSITIVKDPISVPKLRTDNFEIWFKELSLSLKYRNLLHFIDCESYEIYCQKQCKDIRGFEDELFQVNEFMKDMTEDEFMEEVILYVIADRKFKLSQRENENLKRLKNLYLLTSCLQ